MKIKKTIRMRILAVAMFLPSIVFLGYEWKIQGDLGIKADQGYDVVPITDLELAFMALGLISVIISITLIIKTISIKKIDQNYYRNKI